MNETIGGHKQLQLPTSTKIIDIDSSNTSTRFFLQITNWSELTNIEHIFDYDNFDIPFPQIKYQQSKIQKKQRIVFQIFWKGVKFSKWVENKVKYYVEYWENPLILTFVVFPFEIYVGLIISFVNTNGFISYVCLSLVILLLVIVTTKFL
ncbi:hypothetical protein QTN25_002615 [Entamoeba marina]